MPDSMVQYYTDEDETVDTDSLSPEDSDAEPVERTSCIDCGEPLKLHEDKLCLVCENRRYREHGVDDWM